MSARKEVHLTSVDLVYIVFALRASLDLVPKMPDKDRKMMTSILEKILPSMGDLSDEQKKIALYGNASSKTNFN